MTWRALIVIACWGMMPPAMAPNNYFKAQYIRLIYP